MTIGQGAPPRERRARRWCDAIAVALATVAVGLLGWRVALPNNQHRDLDIYAPPAEGEMRAQTTNGHDDVVTIATAHNFARDGFLRTHLLPNRRGAPLVSYFDFSHTQCETLAQPGRPLVYPNFWDEPTEMLSLNHDCIYTHYPPLADWVFGAMAALGLDRVLHYKLLAVLLHGTLLLALYAWLGREVGPGSALTATAVIATSPAFFEWAGALYYQPFQYLFLVAGMLCWSLYLERPRRHWFAATWVLHFCEALVSYELVAFFGIALAGYLLLDRSHRSSAARARLLALQASAPAAATLFHIGLRVSLFGLARTWHNARITAWTRMVEGYEPWRMELWFNRIHFKLLPFGLMALALVLIFAVRLAARAGVRRPLALLATLLAGGLSFAAIFPGMALMHTWMMYRHLVPFVAALLAYLADVLWRAVELASAPSGAGPLRVARAGLWTVAAIFCCIPLSWAVRRGGKAIAAEVAWNAAANRHRDPRNLAVRFLDALYWRERGPQAYSVGILTPLDGHRVDEPAHPSPGFAIVPGSRSHYEIWWLEEIDLAQVSFLTDRASEAALESGCGLTFFDGEAFAPPDAPRVERAPFAPGPGEPERPYAWVRYGLRARSRAIRLTCAGLAPLPIHHVEVLSSPRQP